MADRCRLTFLTRHYYDLKGLVFVPIWCAGILALVWHPRGAKESVAALLGLIVLLILSVLVIGRYYRTHFGWPEPDPICLGIKTGPKGVRTVVAWLLSVALGSELLYGLRTGSLKDFVSLDFAIIIIVFADLMIQKVRGGENPPARRVGYGIGAVLIVSVELFHLFAKCDLKAVLAVLSVVMLILNIGDHLLLVSLLTPPDNEIKV